MGGGKGGGGYSAGPMLQYGDKALKLQEKIYNEQRQDAQPWYQTGASAVGQLGTLLGLNPSTSSTSRQSLVDQYKPQFTSTSTSSSSNPLQYSDSKGKVHNFANEFEKNQYFAMHGGEPYFTPIGGSSSTSTTDHAGLNAYIDKLLADQAAQNQSNPLFGSLAKSFSMDDYQEDPGYQFRLGEGQKALERKLNASGKTYSPEAAKALLSYNQDMGSQEYNNAYNRFNIDQDNLFNRLATLSGFGQTATGQIANAGSNYANAGSDIYTGMGNAITASNIARSNNNSSMFNSLLGAGAQLGGAYLMSDKRLKENIISVGEKNGYPLYKFNYIHNPETTYIGVIAQDIEKITPEAVFEVEGYKAVDYSKLGIEMTEVKDAA